MSETNVVPETSGTQQLSGEESKPVPGTTTFIDDTVGNSAEPVKRQDLISSLVKLNEISGVSDIISFLQKPTRIGNGSLTTSDTTALFTLDPWQSLIQSVKSNKLLGVGLLRADIVVKLEVNAVRFQQGRYILSWLPYGGSPSYGNPPFKRAHTANLMTISQLPHVEIDIATQTHATLRIPYTSDMPYLPSQNTLIQYGALCLYPYVPLQAGSGDTTAPYTVWAWFEKISLSAPSIPQSNFKIKKTVARKEQEAGGFGPVSSVAYAVSEASAALGKIPVLGDFAKTASWVANSVGNVASMFGFSRPALLSPPVRYVRDIFPYMSNANQVTTGVPLALMSDNEITLSTGVASTDIDEMSIDFIKQQYAYFTALTWHTTDAADTSLWSHSVQPQAYQLVMGKGLTLAPVSLVGQFFRFWRGGMKFRFKLVKTEFHSGRLMISFTPAFFGSGPAWTVALSEYLYREIIDIRTTTEFEVEIPYVNPEIWLTQSELSGILQVNVLDPLVAPSTVTGNISIIVEVAGADDLEYAFPIFPAIQPYCPATPMSGYQVAKSVRLGSTQDHTDELCAATVGERITSLRQILKRTQFCDASITGEVGVSLTPFLVDSVTQATNNSAALIRSSHPLLDSYSLLAHSYLFNTGSTNVRFYNGTRTGSLSIMVLGANDIRDSIAIPHAQDVTWASNPNYIVDENFDPRVDVMIPGYHRRLARTTPLQLVTPTIGTSEVDGACLTGVDMYVSSSSATYVFARPIGDDFNFSKWLGTVPVVTGSSVT